MKALLTLAHGNAEVERSLSENSKVLRSERSLLSDESINAIRITKDAIRVAGSGHAHKMPITPSLLQARRSAYAAYSKRMEEEKARKEKERQQRAKEIKDNQDKQEALKELESRKRSLSEKECNIAKEQATQEEELRTAERLFLEANKRLQDAIKEKNMSEMTVVQGLLDVAKVKMEAARKKLEECRKEKEVVDSKRKMVMDRIVSSLRTKNK